MAIERPCQEGVVDCPPWPDVRDGLPVRLPMAAEEVMRALSLPLPKPKGDWEKGLTLEIKIKKFNFNFVNTLGCLKKPL